MRKRTMNVTIQIFSNTSGNSILRRGYFPLRGRKTEVVALEFWKWIKGEHPHECKIKKIIVDGEDVTDKVKVLVDINISQGD
jgi:hypothetical protein